jgi:hypothetical protein
MLLSSSYSTAVADIRLLEACNRVWSGHPGILEAQLTADSLRIWDSPTPCSWVWWVLVALSPSQKGVFAHSLVALSHSSLLSPLRCAYQVLARGVFGAVLWCSSEFFSAIRWRRMRAR